MFLPAAAVGDGDTGAGAGGQRRVGLLARADDAPEEAEFYYLLLRHVSLELQAPAGSAGLVAGVEGEGDEGEDDEGEDDEMDD